MAAGKNKFRITNALFLLVLVVFSACSERNKTETSTSTSQQKTEAKSTKPANIFTELAQSVFNIETFDGQRILEKGKCFLITPTTLVAPFSLFSSATRAVITPLNGGKSIEISQYFTYDRINNLILLKVDGIDAQPLKLYGGKTVKGVKTTIIAEKQGNTQPLYTGTCLQEQVVEGRKLFSISNTIGKTSIGAPVFVSNGSVLGLSITEEIMYKQQYFAVPSTEIFALLRKAGEPKTLASVGSQNGARNAAVKHIILETDFGNIEIKLYNQTSAYRDNFIQLAEEGFYDSLLIHRVIRDFGIQMGAADTRNAKFDDVVGWKGPGYTIAAHIVTGLFHKRGAIGSPRKPDDKNHNRRSDGSQFYIVTGRKYTDEELDGFEKENGIKFTPEQRNVYKTIGGAPHLDGSYTVFGEVVSGLDVADRMTVLPVHGDFRPMTDIRLKKVIVEF